MKNPLIYLLLICSLGCAVSTSPYSQSQIGSTSVIEKKKELTNINHVYVGMSINQVESVMGELITIGYETKDEEAGIIEPITLQNPHRKEEITANGKTYNVIYYFTDIKIADDLVAEEELTPLVFEGDRLVGKDWDYVYGLK